MKDCSKCGLWSADSASHCQHCGEAFADVPQEEIVEIEVSKNRKSVGGIPESDSFIGGIESHLLKAIIATILFFPIGLVAIIYAVSVGSKKRANDIDGAIKASTVANKLSKIAIWFGILPWILYLLFCLYVLIKVAVDYYEPLNEESTAKLVKPEEILLARYLQNFVFVQGGTFMMGCTEEQGNDCGEYEKPAHSVTVKDFYIGKYEVTQGLWMAVMGNNPSKITGDDNLPVESVSWNDVQEFIEKLNAKTDKTYRLPTEAEWEYAARGGNVSKGYKYSGSSNIDDVAWYDGNSGETTHPVGTKQHNELGIYDMSGNLWEWVSDYNGSYNSFSAMNPQGPSSGSARVLRGGSWHIVAWNCRVSNRYSHIPSSNRSHVGFRLALSTEGADSLTNGRSGASIQRVVMENMAELRYAYTKRLRDKPKMAGKVTVKFAIDEFGTVIFAQMVESTLNDSKLENTVVTKVKSWVFEEINKPGDITEVIYPFIFSE